MVIKKVFGPVVRFLKSDLFMYTIIVAYGVLGIADSAFLHVFGDKLYLINSAWLIMLTLMWAFDRQFKEEYRKMLFRCWERSLKHWQDLLGGEE